MIGQRAPEPIARVANTQGRYRASGPDRTGQGPDEPGRSALGGGGPAGHGKCRAGAPQDERGAR